MNDMDINDIVISDAESLVPGGASQVRYFSQFALIGEPATDQAAHDELVAIATAALRKVTPWFEPCLLASEAWVFIGPGLFAHAMSGPDGKVVFGTINPICREMQRIAGENPTSPPEGTFYN